MPTPSPYTGPSIVDYLNSIGQSSDYTSRANLASSKGINNYTGSAEQNTQLLSLLRSNGAPSNGGGTLPPRNDINYAALDPNAGGNGTAVTRGPNESLADYQKRILNSPFSLAGGQSSTYNNYMTPDQIQSSYLKNLIQNTPPMAQMKLPSVNYNTPGNNGVGGLLSYYDSLFQTEDEKRKAAQTQRDALAKNEAAQTKPLIDKIIGAPDLNQVRDAATAATGINPAEYFATEKAQIAKIGALNEQYNGLIAARDSQIAQTQDKLASTNFISNQIAQINRNAAPRLNELSANINAESALLQASQGMYSEAQKFINNAVDAATAEQKYVYDQYSAIKAENAPIFAALDKSIQEAWDTQLNAAEKAWTSSVNEKTKVGDLMIANPQAGISISDTFDQAMSKVEAHPKSTSTGSTVGSAESGYTNVIRDSSGRIIGTQPIIKAQPAGSGFTTTQTNNGAVNAGVDVETFKTFPSDVQNFMTNGKSADIQAISDALAEVASGKMKAADFTKSLTSGDLKSINISSTVKSFFETQAKAAEKQAPAKEPGFFSKLWNKVF